MTASSGPGISLYSENIGLAIIGEVPLVIVDVQRLGPATGGATTVGQGDVQFVRWGTAGGYPIVALAPSSVAECYSLTRRAFDLAERFRCPVFLLTDKELNMTTTTVEVDRYEKPTVRARSTLGAYAPPYRFVPAGEVPPIAQYGGDALVRFTGSTHDERALMMLEMLEEKGFAPENVYAVTLAGNTTMSHFFWGLDPANICKEPYIPAANRFPVCHAGEVGLDAFPLALLYLFPNVGSYVGGDLVAFLYGIDVTTPPSPVPGPCLYLDLGTNGEMALTTAAGIFATSAAAGASASQTRVSIASSWQ